MYTTHTIILRALKQENQSNMRDTMSNRMLRTQILLEPEQHQQLTELAQSEQRSMSDLIREMVRQQLAIRTDDRNRLLRDRLSALETIEQHRRRILKRRNGQPLDMNPQQIIDQLREEQDERYFTALS